MTSTQQPMTAPTSVEPHALNDFWRDAFNNRDLTALMTTYEPDAVIFPGPGADPLQGHDAIAEALEWFLGLGGTLRYTPCHWIVAGDICFSSIAFELDSGTGPDGTPMPLTGVTYEVLRRQADGSWKYVIDHPFGGSPASIS